MANETDDFGYIKEPMLRAVVVTKRRLGLQIHLPQYPHLCDQVDIPLVAYINTLIDKTVVLKKKELKSRGAPDYYGVRHLLLDVFKDEERARAAWSAIRHRVSECPQQVLTYCEKVFEESGEPLPAKPQTAQPLVAAE